ncbi:MAG TPA: stress response translation initiation inhibitor YciH [Candidatus Norongarragalinales archaeon]|jgi:translation initiation factor 1|nr:stress response translation initiation inhibitor YciH [Candidatus Norongarragalinales archaeon]
MSQICQNCGLPLEICACKSIEKETTLRLKVSTEKKKFNKYVTIIEGLDGGELERVAKEMKRKLACGGSAKEGRIELQGDHKRRAAEYLVALGYPREVVKVA